MLLIGQLVFLLQIITETSYSFGAVFFLQYCDNTLLAGVLIFLGRGLMMRYPDVVNSYKNEMRDHCRVVCNSLFSGTICCLIQDTRRLRLL